MCVCVYFLFFYCLFSVRFMGLAAWNKGLIDWLINWLIDWYIYRQRAVDICMLPPLLTTSGFVVGRDLDFWPFDLILLKIAEPPIMIYGCLLTIFGLIMTLTVDHLTLKSYLFVFAPMCAFPKRFMKYRVHRTDELTDGRTTENIMPLPPKLWWAKA